jgi:hypothetical protein
MPKLFNLIVYSLTLSIALTACTKPATISAPEPANPPNISTKENPTKIGTNPPDLIKTTDPDSWSRVIVKNRPDPFSIFTQEPHEVTSSLQNKPSKAKIVKIDAKPKLSSKAARKTTTSKKKDNAPPVKHPNIKPPLANKPAMPKPIDRASLLRKPKSDPKAIAPPNIALTPSDIAKKIEFLGTIEVEQKLQILLKLPDNSTVQFLSLGEKINGTEIIAAEVLERDSTEPRLVLKEGTFRIERPLGKH